MGSALGMFLTFSVYLQLANWLVLLTSCILLVNVMSPGKYQHAELLNFLVKLLYF